MELLSRFIRNEKEPSEYGILDGERHQTGSGGSVFRRKNIACSDGMEWSDFSEMVDRTGKILKFSDDGHSASIHSNIDERKVELAIKTNMGRINCNMPHATANSGSFFNGQPTTDSLGGGTWAGNMTSDNINWRHFLNYTWLSDPIPEHIPTDEELFGDYLKKWGRD